VVGALLLLAMLAPFAVLASEMPRAVAWPLACVAAVSGLHAALREARRPARLLALPPAQRRELRLAARARATAQPAASMAP
jgi:toxin CptA